MHVICIGAGPAGLTAAYLLAKEGIAVTVLEKDARYVGGISRTEQRDGFCFDIGGHRFFSKSPEVEALWDEILGDDFLHRPRKSRIYYGGKFYPYPLKAWESLRNMGLIEALRCLGSYAWARLFPVAQPRNFEEWVSNRFGKRLYRLFFKTYTEKVWGMECREISADWAAQRIKGLSLYQAVMNALLPRREKTTIIKTLIDRFRYPRKGPGMMWERATEKIRTLGGAVELGCEVTGLQLVEGKWQVSYRHDEQTHRLSADHVISSAPLSEVARALPGLPQAAYDAAKALRYRDFLIVALVMKESGRFDDNWLYIHDPAVRVGRIQNFKSWSPEMVPDPALTCYGMEYFCFEGDGLWSSGDDALVALAARELVALNLAAPEEILRGYVVRQPKAYPVYDEGYEGRVAAIREALETHYPTLHPVGRNGMHKYNNQDHAMMTAMLSVRNILGGGRVYDIWKVNQDAEYHETLTRGEMDADSGGRAVPGRAR